MNWLDLVLVIFILLGGIKGYRKGFIDQLSGLVAILLAIFLSLKFSDVIRGFLLEKEIVSENFVGITSIALTFLLVFLAVKWTSNLVEKFMKTVGINFLNRVAGTVVGIIINFMIVSVIVYFVYPIVNGFDIEIMNQSQLLPTMYDFIKDLAKQVIG